MSDMRTFLDLVGGRLMPNEADAPFSFLRSLQEGDVISLGDVKQQRQDDAFSKATSSYADVLRGIIDGERARYEAEGGKFEGLLVKFEQEPEPFKEKKLYWGIAVSFRDFRPSPEARKIIPALRQMKLKNTMTGGYHKDFKGTKEGPFYQGEIPVEEAVRLFKGRDTEEIMNSFGAYCPSRLGFGSDSQRNYNDAGVGFSIWLGNYYDGHVIDTFDDLKAALRVYRRFLDVVKNPKAPPAPAKPSLNVVDKAPPAEKPAQGSFDFGDQAGRGRSHLRSVK